MNWYDYQLAWPKEWEDQEEEELGEKDCRQLMPDDIELFDAQDNFS